MFDSDEAFRPFCSIVASGSQVSLAPKIARHGADEDKNGRIFDTLLRKRGLDPVAVLADTDYTHSRVTEQRASEQMRALRRYAGGRPDISRPVKVISNDEDNHLTYGPRAARDPGGPAIASPGTCPGMARTADPDCGAAPP
jgi:hypothetical protein